ncbi:MAG TPA: biotin-dependent carboxyltransferase family protein [Woeseiaceae bacterium]|nr:biotin-dependent carboxyltransferase family protein [Woeseiaceae bacterium]
MHVIRPGLQTTIQAGPRRRLRHLGIPAAGAADPLSLALANRLVGNAPEAAGLEITLYGPVLDVDAPAMVAVTGADVAVRVNGEEHPLHESFALRAGDRLEIGACSRGARSYLAVGGAFAAVAEFGSVSTYMPAALGGLDGRALRAGDRLDVAGRPPKAGNAATPSEFRPVFTDAWALRACPGAEAGQLGTGTLAVLTGTNWTVGRRADRMGLELTGALLAVESAGRMPSAPVFPGTLQCPGDGTPFLLGIDAQTTGGYPRVLQVARCDRHLLGQLRPGDRLRLLLREPAAAVADLRDKHAYFARWLPDIASVV